MKKLTILPVFLLAGVFASAQTINIGADGLVVNDVNVSANWRLPGFIKALGEPGRTIVDFSKTHIYDDKGIVVQENLRHKQPTDTVVSFIIHFVIPTPQPGSPDKTFSGSVMINRFPLSKTTSYADLKKGMKGWKEIEPNTLPSSHAHRYTNGKLYLMFFFSDESATALRMISMGWQL